MNCISNVITAYQGNDGQFRVQTAKGNVLLAQLLGDLHQGNGHYKSLGMSPVKLGGIETLAISIFIFFQSMDKKLSEYFIQDQDENQEYEYPIPGETAQISGSSIKKLK